MTRRTPPPRTQERSTSWLDLASCRDTDPGLFDMEGPWQRGVAICGGCQVRDACLADAMATERGESGRWGVRGGLTDKQRDRLKRRGRAGPPLPVPQPPRWPLGAPCTVCGVPCASDRARRRDPVLRDRYGRHIARGLCLNCYRQVDGHKADRAKARARLKRAARAAAGVPVERARDERGKFVRVA